MKCVKCGRDREFGYKLSGLFFCNECGTESIYSIVSAGIGEFVDSTIDVESENTVVGEVEAETVEVDAPDVSEISENSAESENPVQENM